MHLPKRVKTALLVVALIAVALWVSFEVAHVYRITERVNTRVLLPLHKGVNHLYLTLPKGTYQCRFYANPDFKALNAVSDQNEIPAVVTIRLNNRETPVSRKKAGDITFNIKDDDYQIIDIETEVLPELIGPMYLLIRGDILACGCQQ